jgi:hypothetical protein
VGRRAPHPLSPLSPLSPHRCLGQRCARARRRHGRAGGGEHREPTGAPPGEQLHAPAAWAWRSRWPPPPLTGPVAQAAQRAVAPRNRQRSRTRWGGWQPLRPQRRVVAATGGDDAPVVAEVGVASGPVAVVTPRSWRDARPSHGALGHDRSAGGAGAGLPPGRRAGPPPGGGGLRRPCVPRQTRPPRPGLCVSRSALRRLWRERRLRRGDERWQV